MGWYGNNCGCNEHQNVASWGPPATKGQHDGIRHYQGDIQATIDFGFDGIKLDGCGEFKNLSYFAELMNATGKPILVEDCHWGGDGPGDWGDGGKRVTHRCLPYFVSLTRGTLVVVHRPPLERGERGVGGTTISDPL